jgi:hypothetical protein
MNRETLQYQVETTLSSLEKEKVRAEQVSKANIEALVIQANADAKYYQSNTESDAKLYMEMKLAEADKVMYDAQSCGITLLHKAFNEDNFATLTYIMLEKGLHKDLAQINNMAIEDLKPDMRIFSANHLEGNQNIQG